VSRVSGDLWWLGDRQVLSFPAHASRWSRVGWAAFYSQATQDAGVQVYVRFGMSRPGVGFSMQLVMSAPLVVREVVVRSQSEAAVTGLIMRELPVGRMEAAANRRLRRTATGSESYPFVNDEWDTVAPSHLQPQPWMKFPGWEHQDHEPKSMKLAIPADRRKPDTFYAEVAERYQWLASMARRPAEELAEANGVPATTVHRWVKEARRRGFLPPGQRGRGESS
jgi:hypothetical protein